MKTTKEKIGLIMLAIMAMGGLAGMIIGAFMIDFWFGAMVVGALLYMSIMIKCLFDE